jgi:SAM-dependent methyltransferase
LRDGVLRCLDLSDEPEDRIKRQEVEARDKAAEGYNRGQATFANRVEMPPCLDALAAAKEDVVAELGCGTGRITLQYLPKVSRVVAVDFSLESLFYLQQQIPAEYRDRILLVQADITALPLADRAYTKAASFQVIEHLPSAESRQRVITNAARLLRAGGTFTFSVYHWSLGKQHDAAHGVGDYTQKEGYHDTGIYYYNFDAQEVRDGVTQAGLKTELMQGLIVPMRGGSLLGPLWVPVNRWLGKTTYGLRRAHLVLARGRA